MGVASMEPGSQDMLGQASEGSGATAVTSASSSKITYNPTFFKAGCQDECPTGSVCGLHTCEGEGSWVALSCPSDIDPV